MTYHQKPYHFLSYTQALLAELMKVTKNDLTGASILTEHEDGIQTGALPKDAKMDSNLVNGKNGKWFHVKAW